MDRVSRALPMSPRPLAAALGIAIAISITFWLLSNEGGNAHASTESSYANYPALASTAPTSLPLVTSHHFYKPGDPIVPTFPATLSSGFGGNVPVPSTIRKVTVGLSDITAWISKSSEGGICVLATDNKVVDHNIGVSFSCAKASQLGQGAAVEISEIPGEPGRTVAVGVAPDDKSTVSDTLPTGAVKTVTVSGNAWAYETNSAATTAATSSN